MNVIIDTGCANLSSVKFAVERLGYEVTISRDPQVLKTADKLFLPGVGTAKEAMANLRERQLVDHIKALTQPVLGICLGMQLLAQGSDEGDVDCLGLVPGRISQMQTGKEERLPHMGWNQIHHDGSHPLFQGIPSGSYFYFVHSYALPVNAYTLASCDYAGSFTAAVGRDNFFGVQFHPERSGKAGAQLIRNFLEL